MMLVLPEIILTATVFIVFIFDIFRGKNGLRLTSALAMTGLLLAAGSVFYIFGNSGFLLGGRFAVNPQILIFKLIFILAALFTTVLASDNSDNQFRQGLHSIERSGEFLVLMLFTLLGMMFLTSARDLVTLYVSLELSTIPLFLLCAWSKSPKSSEAGLKYVVLGALSSAFLLFGISLFYGFSGSLILEDISALPLNAAYWYALSLIGVGVGFKLAIFPFHMWAPDVYEGAPTPVTAYLSVASKTLGVVLAVMLFAKLGHNFSDGNSNQWKVIIAVISAFTMTVGNVAAISQKNIKRFMAYSSISQAGYIIMGLLGGAAEGLPAIQYYMLGYLFTNIAVFSVIIIYANQTGREEIDDYAGLSLTHPVLSLVMMVALFSLAGIPPLAGFTGKFFLFSLAAKSGYYWLVALAAVNSTISLYYYLRIVRQMYIEKPSDEHFIIKTGALINGLLALTLAGTIIIGIMPVFFEKINASQSVIIDHPN